jgi:restriction system protein
MAAQPPLIRPPGLPDFRDEKQVASRMQKQERNIAVEIVRGAFAAVWLPFSWAASAPANALALLRRSALSAGEPGQTAERARFDTDKWTLELLKRMDWRRFEELCVAYFESLGYQASVTRPRQGASLDIALRARDADSASVLVHCKGWDAYRIGAKAVRELRAAMTLAGLAEGVVVTCARFTQDAAALAAREKIKLIDGAGLLARLEELPAEAKLGLLKFATQGDFLTPTCPACSIKMTARRSTSEGRKFWGCRNYPQCKETFSGIHPPA